jgi:hypothetical protein
MPKPKPFPPPLPEGVAEITTVFEVRVRGDMDGERRTRWTNHLLTMVSEAGLEGLVIGYQEVNGEEMP